MPTCHSCKREKLVEEFPLRPPPRRHRHTRCHSCIKDYARRWYQRNREHHQRRSADWKLANPERRCANNANYRARKQQATIPLSAENTRRMQEIYQRAWKLTQKTGVPHQVDHWVPLVHPLVCGLHVPWNLTVLPAKTNAKKKNELTLDTLAPDGTPYTC